VVVAGARVVGGVVVVATSVTLVCGVVSPGRVVPGADVGAGGTVVVAGRVTGARVVVAASPARRIGLPSPHAAVAIASANAVTHDADRRISPSPRRP
jgi:hypothetical protein